MRFRNVSGFDTETNVQHIGKKKPTTILNVKILSDVARFLSLSRHSVTGNELKIRVDLYQYRPPLVFRMLQNRNGTFWHLISVSAERHYTCQSVKYASVNEGKLNFPNDQRALIAWLFKAIDNKFKLNPIIHVKILCTFQYSIWFCLCVCVNFSFYLNKFEAMKNDYHFPIL